MYEQTPFLNGPRGFHSPAYYKVPNSANHWLSTGFAYPPYTLISPLFVSLPDPWYSVFVSAQSSSFVLQRFPNSSKCRTPTWGKTGAINTAEDKITNGSLPVRIKKALKGIRVDSAYSGSWVYSLSSFPSLGPD
eukprot:123753-Rhodomonas_salina.1